MQKTSLITAIVFLSACSVSTTQPQEIEATRDFVAATELTEVSEIRLSRQLSYSYVNDRFVTVPTRRGDYLVELQRNCHELRETQFDARMIDERDNTNVLRARFDTIRGCRIATMYEITKSQKEEIKALGDAPGDEIYMPDDK
jgi:hypothetical protein